MTVLRRWIIRIILLSILPASCIIYFHQYPQDWMSDAGRLVYLLLLLALLAILTGWRFRRPDVMWHAAVFALCGWSWWTWGLQAPVRLDALALNTVWSAALLFSLWLNCGADRPVNSPLGVINFSVLLLAPATVTLWINGLLPDSVTRLLESVPGRFAAGSTAVPLSLTALLATIVMARTVRHRTSEYLATMGALFAFSAGFLFSENIAFPFLGCLVALLVLLIGVVDQISRVAFLDALTGLPGRRALAPVLAQLTGMYSIAVADIDHFKRFNDRYGHDVGDQVLRKVASKLERPGAGGRTYRVGGEEFLLLFTGKSVSDVQPVLESLRKSIEAEPFLVRDKGSRKRSDASKRGRGTRSKQTVTVTVSIGLADAGRNDSAKQTWKAADKALYRAKKRGRNRVCR